MFHSSGGANRAQIADRISRYIRSTEYCSRAIGSSAVKVVWIYRCDALRTDMKGGGVGGYKQEHNLDLR